MLTVTIFYFHLEALQFSKLILDKLTIVHFHKD